MKKIIMSSSTVEFFHVLVSPGIEPGTRTSVVTVMEFHEHKFFSAKFPLPFGLGVVRLARVREVQGSNLSETRT